MKFYPEKINQEEDDQIFNKTTTTYYPFNNGDQIEI